MKHLILLVVSLLIALPATAADLHVVTTTTDLAALVKIIGGESVEVEALCRGYQDPHYLEAKPSHMSRLRRADLMAYVGLELEVGWLPLLINGARNPRLRLGEPGNLPMTTDLTILEIPTGDVSRSEGDIHPLGNPHYWMDPRNQIVMAQTITDRLTRMAPDHASEFEAARAAFAGKMGAAIEVWEQRMAPWRGHEIVCYHKQWEYLVDWLGLTVTDYVENKPGIPPSPRHIRELRDSMKRKKTALVVISNFFEPGPARKVADEAGAQLVILPASVDGEDGLGDPFLLFEYVIDSIDNAFKVGNTGG